MSPTPTDDDKAEFLLSCRYGELDDVRRFVDTFGAEAALCEVKDDNGNTPLHMVAGNGHEDILTYLLSLLPLLPSSKITSHTSPAPTPTPTPTHPLSTPNSSGSTPAHWASLNAHLPILQLLVNYTPGPGTRLLDAHNDAGVSPLGEAERAGWAEGARWMVSVMDFADGGSADGEGAGAQGGNTGEGGEEGEGDVDADADADGLRDVEVEIEDADGGIAKMSLSAKDVANNNTAMATASSRNGRRTDTDTDTPPLSS